jgi:hypothetical protein
LRRTYNLPYDVIKYLESQDNMSAYLARLVRADMGKDTRMEKLIKDIVSEIKNTLPSERV